MQATSDEKQSNQAVADPPNKIYRCPLCGAWLHYTCSNQCWHCFNCDTNWASLEDLWDAIETDEY